MTTTKRLATLAAAAVLLLSTGCAATDSLTRTAIKANADLLEESAVALAEDKDRCEAVTTTPGWLTRFFGFGNKTETTVECS